MKDRDSTIEEPAEFEENEENAKSLYDQLIESFEQSDSLYRMLRDFAKDNTGKSFNGDIITQDIIDLGFDKRYSTNDVFLLLQQYTYLYDGNAGKSYITDASRLRWWLLEKEEDNLTDYLQVQKTGRNYIWDINSIIRAKIVAILRYVYNYTQREIKMFALGITHATESKVNIDDIRSMISSGEYKTIQNFDLLKEFVIQYVEFNEKRLEQDIGQAFEFAGKQMKESQRNQYDRMNTLLKQQERSAVQMNQLDVRAQLLEARLLRVNEELRLRGEAENKLASEGFFKKILMSGSKREEFIKSYIEPQLKALLENEKALEEAFEKLINPPILTLVEEAPELSNKQEER